MYNLRNRSFLKELDFSRDELLHLLSLSEKPRYSIASNMRPSTRAVSLTDSLWPMCDPLGPMKVTWAPWSNAATSNAHRVRVESFSKISAISLPTSFRSSRPSFLAALSSAARSMR